MFRITMMACLMILSSCASDPISLTKSAEKDFLKGQSYVDDENYAQAVLFLQKFSARYPYSQYATAAEILLIKAAYHDKQYVLSETLGLRFMDAHPDHKDRVYAQFLVAMSYYKQSSSAMLDQQFSHKSRDAFLELNRQFPNNAYGKDIERYLQVLTDRVAENELITGKFYFDKQLYVAAVNRFLVVKNDYLDAKVAAEALYHLASAYLKLQQQSYAGEIINLLQQKFPQSNWYKKALQLK